MNLKEEVEKTVEVLKKGGVILYPTDTIWGLGCDAENESAVKKLLEIKSRKEGKSLIVLVNNEQLLHRYSATFHPICYDLIDLSEKPTTLIYPNAQNMASKIIASDQTVGMRMVKHPFCEAVIQKLKKGLVSTSANKSGTPTGGNFDDIPEEIKKQVDYIVNLERTPKNNSASSIIKIEEDGGVQIIRK